MFVAHRVTASVVVGPVGLAVGGAGAPSTSPPAGGVEAGAAGVGYVGYDGRARPRPGPVGLLQDEVPGGVGGPAARPEALDRLRELCAAGPVMLVFAARGGARNGAVVLREVLEGADSRPERVDR